MDKKLVDFVSEGIILVDDSFRIIETNKVITSWLRCDPEDMKGQNLFKRFSEIKSKKFYKRLTKLFEFNAPVVLSSTLHKHFVEIPLSNDKVMIQETSIYPYEEKGKKRAIICIKDVSKHHQSIENVRKNSEKVKKLAESKLNFLSTISHDLRTPLNGIVGSIELLGDLDLTEEQKEHTETIRTCSDFLLNLINDFLDVTKIESNKFSIEKNDITLLSLVNNIEQIFNEKMLMKGLSFVVNANFDKSIRVAVDELRLTQVLVNLLGNAYKFTTHGHVSFSIEIQNDNILFIITDSGKGIPDGDQEEIFEVFGQVERQSRGASEGTGLGLSIVNSLVELMKGTLSLNSSIGKGTEIKVQIPFELGQLKVGEICEKRTRNKVELSSLRVLVAEDNNVNQRIVKKFFNKYDIEPLIVENGLLAVEACEKEQFDIVFMDYRMPIMDGIEAAQTILEKFGFNSPILVAVSANALSEDTEAFKAAGFHYILPKPYTLKMFTKLLEKIISMNLSNKKIA